MENKEKIFGKIIVYNTKTEDHTSEANNFYIGRSRSRNPLGNPFTHNGVRTNLAKLTVKTREEAIEAYERYFDKAYEIDSEMRSIVDKMYEKYKNGETIYLQCFCKPLPCHGDVIAKKLQERLVRERLSEMRNENKEEVCVKKNEDEDIPWFCR